MNKAPRPRRVATLVQMFLMSDGTVETKFNRKVKDTEIPVEFLYDNMSKATAGFLEAIKQGLVKK